MRQKRKFAVLDVDGTLIRWQLYHAIGDGMAKQGIIEQKEFERVRRARMNWKTRSGSASFNEYEQALIKVFDKAITGLDTSLFKTIVGKVFDEYKEQVYTFSRDLIRDLKKKDYLLFALSGSPNMIVSLIAQYYEFNDFAGTDYEVVNGKFTGTKILALGKKGNLLKDLIKKHDASTLQSISVGDSEGDIDMLRMCEQPIAFNPSKDLYDYATVQKWPIVLERKNVVYKLEFSNGNYRLI